MAIMGSMLCTVYILAVSGEIGIKGGKFTPCFHTSWAWVCLVWSSH